MVFLLESSLGDLAYSEMVLHFEPASPDSVPQMVTA